MCLADTPMGYVGTTKEKRCGMYVPRQVEHSLRSAGGRRKGKIMENRTKSEIETAETAASPPTATTASSASGASPKSGTSSAVSPSTVPAVSPSAEPTTLPTPPDMAAGSAPNCCCHHRTKERTPEEYKDLINRLSRIEGQIRGLKRMVEEGAYCPDILTQSAAAGSALNSFNRVLMANHIRTCVADDIREGNDETIDELLKTLQKLMK